MAQNVFNVEAAALFFDRPELDKIELLTELNKKFADRDGCYLTMSPLSHDTWWLLCCEHFHIMITFSDTAVPQDVLDFAKRSQTTGLNRFDYVQAAETHRTAIKVEIGDGDAPLPPEARMIMQEFGKGRICDPALKMIALHHASQFICDHAGFLALHFGPSQRMFCTEELNAVAATDYPAELLFHPVPTLPEKGANGTEGWCLTLHNPDPEAGLPISLEGLPVSVPLATAVQLLRTLVRAQSSGKLALPHGKVLKPSAKLALYARHVAPDAGSPNGRVVLSFWSDSGHDGPAPDMTPEAPASITQDPADQPPCTPEEATVHVKPRRPRLPIKAEDLRTGANGLATPSGYTPRPRPKVPPELAQGKAAAAARRMRKAGEEGVQIEASKTPRSLLARLLGRQQGADADFSVLRVDGTRIAGIAALAMAALAATPSGLQADMADAPPFAPHIAVLQDSGENN